MKYLFLFFVCFSVHAQNKCYVENPSIEGQYMIYNKSQSECNDWFNSNISDGSFNCNGECILKIEDISSIMQEKELDNIVAKRISCGNRTIKFIAKLNAGKQLSKEQRKQMIKSYADILDQLKSGAVDIAKDDIGLINADGVIVTDQDKIDIINFILSCE